MSDEPEPFYLRPPTCVLLVDTPLSDKGPNVDSFGLNIKLGPVYDAIRHKDMATPFTVMVSGGWGVGKSSAMRWMKGQLDRWTGKCPPGSVKVDTAWFDPWMYQSREDVWRGLIACVILASIKSQRLDKQTLKRAAILLTKLFARGSGRVFDSIKARLGLPGLADVEVDAGELAKIADDWKDLFSPQKDYLNDFENSFRSWVTDSYDDTHRLCIFIDDLDRCMPDVAFQVLEALKLYLNVPNLVFVVGVDKEVVQHVVTKRYEELVGESVMRGKDGTETEFAHKAAQYLDKMFQIEVDVTPHDQQIGAFVDRLLEKNPLWQEVGEYQHVFRRLVLREAKRNPRSVVRNLNTLFQGAARVKFADPSLHLTAAQTLQHVFLLQVCRDRKYEELPLQTEGQAFLEAWSKVLQGSPEPYFVDPALLVDRKEAAREEMMDAPRPKPDLRFVELLAVGDRHPAFRSLLGEERIGLLLKVPYTPVPGEILNKTTEGMSDSASSLSPALREAIARSLGIASEELTPGHVTSVDRLSLTETTDEDLAGIGLLASIEWLDLSYTQVTDAGLESLKSLASLQSLNLSRTRVTDAGLESLKSLASLQSLNLSRTQVTDAGLEHLESLKSLRTLVLSGTQVTGAGLGHLKSLTSLESLVLSGTQVTGAGLGHLKSLTSLESLVLSGTQVTGAGLGHLKSLTSLESLVLSGTQVMDAGLENLESLTSLQTLDLGETQVTDAGLEHLKSLTSLKGLDLSRTRVTDAGLECLKSLTSLEHLDLGETQVTDAGLECLKSLTSLEHLDLGETQVTDAGLECLKSLTSLEHLDLGETQVTDAGLERLKSLTSLEHLDLSGTRVTDAGLEHLKSLTLLQWLYLPSSINKRKAKALLEASIPGLHIY